MIRSYKICSKCGDEKHTDEFGAQLSAPDLLKPWCKMCYVEYNKERYRQKKQEMKENAVKWRESHPEEFRVIQEKYRVKKKLKKDLARVEEKYLKNEQEKKASEAGHLNQNRTEG